MKKLAMTLSVATLLLGGMVGCGNDDKEDTTGLGVRDQRGFGYHTTDDQDTVNGDNRRGEGPITDMFTRDDRRGARGFGRDRHVPLTRNRAGITDDRNGEIFDIDDQRDQGNTGNRPGFVDDRGVLRGKQTRINDHERVGRLGDSGRVTPNNNIQQFSYPAGYDAATVRNCSNRIANVENVQDSRVIAHGNRIIIAVDTDRQHAQKVEQDIRQRVAGMTGNKEVIVVTEDDRYDQIRTLDDRLRAGEPIEEVGATINEMMRDFGRAIQRPFTQSR